MPEKEAPSRVRFTLSEDWLATLIGLAIVLVIGAGLIGPGPQSVKVSAAPGEVIAKNAKAVDDWTITATYDGDSTPISGAVQTDLTKGARYIYACGGDEVQVSEADMLDVSADVAAPDADQAQIVLVNGCNADVTLTFKIDYAIRWPIFNIFD